MLRRSQMIEDLKEDCEGEIEKRKRYKEDGSIGSYVRGCPYLLFKNNTPTRIKLDKIECELSCEDCWDNLILAYDKPEKRNNMEEWD